MGTRWTESEKQILREHWASGGKARCQRLLPNRKGAAIRIMANRLGLVTLKRALRKPVKWTEFMDAQVKKAYETPKRGTLARVAKQLGISVSALKWRGQILGCVSSHAPYRCWTEEENDIAMEWGHRGYRYTQVKLKRAGFKRSLPAIRTQLNQLGGVDKDSDPDSFNATRLATLFGVSKTVVLRWIQKGYFPAKKEFARFSVAPTEDHKQFHIKIADVKRFVRNHPTLIDLKKVDPVWFISVFVGPPVHDPDEKPRRVSLGDGG